MSTTKLTDEAVAMLPLEAGRAELLEEIMTTVAPDRPVTAPESPRRPSRWLVPVAAAAAVVAIAAATIWSQGLLPGEEKSEVASPLNLPEGQGIVLDAPGWTVDALNSDGIMFRKGQAELEVTTYDAEDYDSYVEDREHIYDPPAPGEPIQVLGRDAQMWAYSPDDHAAIRVVEDGHWLEVRGSGMDEAAYLDLLDQLRLTSQVEFEASLPNGYVTEGGRQAAADKIVRDIRSVSGKGFPGDAPSFADGDAKDRYQFGAEVVGAYACAWLESYANAVSHDQQGQVDEAVAVLGTSREWPILREMDADGDYPEVLWQIADEAAAGDLQDSYREGLGC